MATIRKKCWPEWFQAIVDGRKKYDVRISDFVCQTGDILILEEWNPKTKEYTGRRIEKKVTYVSSLKTKETKFWKKEDIEKHGFQIMSLE